MRILFQGDSITDAGRSKENLDDLGRGYPSLVAASLGLDAPGEHTFINRGISGNRIVDLYARIRADIINLRPDVLSILIGVNDVWHEFKPDNPNGVPSEKFYKIYSMLIEEIKEALPETKIMILEPFFLPGPATTETEEKTVGFASEVPKRAEMAKRIAEEYGLPFVPLQAGFDRLCELAEPTTWLRDGVHPTPMGHEFIKREWLAAFSAL